MRAAAEVELSDATWLRLWRMLVIGLCALVLCSCRGPHQQAGYDASAWDPAAAAGLSPETLAAGGPAGQWSPPGTDRPWPQDEYLRDGGDRGLPAQVREDWEVLGLELEDTIAHFDTLDGQTLVEPSNRVHIYSPRFGAVRKVSGPVSNKRAKRAAGVHLPDSPAAPTTVQIVTSSQQHVQPGGQVGTKPPVIFHSGQGDGVVSTANKARAYQDAFLPYENLRLIRSGTFDSAEMAWLARGATAAVAWAHNRAVQVLLDHQAAMAGVSDQLPAAVFIIGEPPGKHKLRVVKVASTDMAEPGDEVSFTIRFDNAGNQPIGNVTIIDNLTGRLEYVADSAQCDIPAQFSTQPNEGDSLVIRCEVTDPLEPGQGGIIRFRCRVR